MKQIDPNRVPTTIKEAVDLVFDSLEPDDLAYIREKEGSPSAHMTVGRYLRNTWNFWHPDTPIKRDAVHTYGIAHADDISGLVLAWVYARVMDVPFDPPAYVEEHFHKHWREQGTDSLTAGGWPPDPKEVERWNRDLAKRKK